MEEKLTAWPGSGSVFWVLKVTAFGGQRSPSHLALMRAPWLGAIACLPTPDTPRHTGTQQCKRQPPEAGPLSFGLAEGSQGITKVGWSVQKLGAWDPGRQLEAGEHGAHPGAEPSSSAQVASNRHLSTQGGAEDSWFTSSVVFRMPVQCPCVSWPRVQSLVL